MLSYRHAFHAGNHADCLKHLILTRVLTYLAPRPDAAPGSSGITPVLGASPGVAPCTPGIPPVLGGKDKPLCYCETHAGPGLYALDSPQAQQNQEYLGGIARLWGRQDLHPSLAAYVALVRDCNGPGELRRYPGSPWLAQRLLRPFMRHVGSRHALPLDEVREITTEIALLGVNGLDYASSEAKYSVRSLSDEKKYSGLELIGYMYVGLKILRPDANSSIDLDEPYQMALMLFQPKHPREDS